MESFSAAFGWDLWLKAERELWFPMFCWNQNLTRGLFFVPIDKYLFKTSIMCLPSYMASPNHRVCNKGIFYPVAAGLILPFIILLLGNSWSRWKPSPSLQQTSWLLGYLLLHAQVWGQSQSRAGDGEGTEKEGMEGVFPLSTPTLSSPCCSNISCACSLFLGQNAHNDFCVCAGRTLVTAQMSTFSIV